MANLRHGPPVFHCGWLDKEGANSSRWERYLRLSGTALSNSHSENTKPSWQISLLECPVSCGDRQYEFQIQLRRRVLSYFARTEQDFLSWKDAFKRAIDMQIERFYTFDHVLGEGAFAQVRLGQDLENGENVAIKIINKQAYDSREMQFIMREVKIMMQINHAHIINTYDIFDSMKQLFLVIEYMQGGELFDFIADQDHLSEQDASHVMRDIITGVDYLHDKGIVHCDIKPENILCKSKKWPLQVKLCDFGLANFYDRDSYNSNSTMTAMIGTPGYVAPEVIKREPYGPPVDMWACGVVLYVMLSGKMPFYGKDDVQCLRRTAAGQFAFPDREWASVSEDAKSLVKALLQIRPETRLTAKAALQHKWLALPDQNSRTPIQNDLRSIHSSIRQKFRKAVRAAVTIERMKELVGGISTSVVGNSGVDNAVDNMDTSSEHLSISSQPSAQFTNLVQRQTSQPQTQHPAQTPTTPASVNGS